MSMNNETPPAPERSKEEVGVRALVDYLWQEMCELPDRSSPEDYPDHALVTLPELTAIVETWVERAALEPSPIQGEAWVYELATRVNYANADAEPEYSRFERRLSFDKPDAPKGAIHNLRALYASPHPVTASPEEGVTDDFVHAAQFLVERLDDFENGSLGDDIEDACRDFDGHVSPAIERLRAALSVKPGEQG